MEPSDTESAEQPMIDGDLCTDCDGLTYNWV
jgi:hypothetical protein